MVYWNRFRSDKEMTVMPSHFFAMISRIKYINRWALVGNTREESVCEHTEEVAVLAHTLALLTNRRFGGQVSPERCAVLALYHDVPEIITGDMPTPVKYQNPVIRTAMAQLEQGAVERLVSMLPPDLREDYRPLLTGEAGTEEERRLVKGADKLSALIKCVEELKQGNGEFAAARRSLEEAVRAMHLPAADCFLEEFLPAYELTLDEQDGGR